MSEDKNIQFKLSLEMVILQIVYIVKPIFLILHGSALTTALGVLELLYTIVKWFFIGLAENVSLGDYETRYILAIFMIVLFTLNLMTNNYFISVYCALTGVIGFLRSDIYVYGKTLKESEK